MIQTVSATSSDDFDLGIDPERVYEVEHWRPSADYPEVETIRMRRAGDVLEVQTTPPGGQGAVHTRRAKIDTVWRHVRRAELRFEGADRVVHFDLVSQRVVELPDTFRAPLPITRDPLDVGLWVELCAVLGEEAPRLYPTIAGRTFSRAELEAFAWVETGADERTATARWAAPSPHAAPDDTSWMARHFGLPPSTPPPPGYGLTRHVTPAFERIEAWIAEGSVSLFSIATWTPRDGSASTATAIGYFKPGLAALDQAIGRLGAVLAHAR
jgi:hypothetical protein